MSFSLYNTSAHTHTLTFIVGQFIFYTHTRALADTYLKRDYCFFFFYYTSSVTSNYRLISKAVSTSSIFYGYSDFCVGRVT
jgi:hypothetical protein